MLEDIVRLRRKLEESKRIVLCAPEREQYLNELIALSGLDASVTVQTSPLVSGSEMYVVHQRCWIF